MIFDENDLSKENLELAQRMGYQASLDGLITINKNPFKLNIALRKSWKEGFRVGEKKRFEDLPAEERASYWESQWRQSEFEKHKLIQALRPFACLFSLRNNPPDDYDLIYDDGDGNKIFVRDCFNASHSSFKYDCSDTKEIADEIERNFEWN